MRLNRPAISRKLDIFVCSKYMIGYKKILVPHAGTMAGNKALEQALNIRSGPETKITLLHVVVPLSTPSSFSISANRLDFIEFVNKLQNSVIEDMERQMESIKKKVTDENEGICIDAEVVLGIPENEITRFAKDHQVVVMAKRRKLPGIKAILRLGSTSRKVIEKVSTPILLIDVEDKDNT